MLGERLQKIQRLLAEFSYGLVSAFLHASMWCNSVCLSCNDNSRMRREFLRELFCFPRRRRRREMLRFFVVVFFFLVAGFPFPLSFARVSFLHTPHSVCFVFFFARFSFPYSFPSVSANSLCIILLLLLRTLLVPFCIRYAFAFYIPLTPFLHVLRRLFFDCFLFPSSFSCVSFLHTPWLCFFARFSVPSSFAYERGTNKNDVRFLSAHSLFPVLRLLRLLPLLVP